MVKHMKILTFSAAPAVRLLGEGATACRAALPACLAMQKKNGKGATIPLFFCYANQAGRTTLHAVQLINLG